MIFLLLTLVGCPAEDLGVQLPVGGIDAMTNEDLKRDVWSLSRAPLEDRRVGQPGHEQGLALIEKRLISMKTLPAFRDARQPAGEGFNLCTVQKGQSQEHILITTIDSGVGAYESASGIAGLISLAKGLNEKKRPPHSLLFCVIAGEEGWAHFQAKPPVPLDGIRGWFELGPLGLEGELKEESMELAGKQKRFFHSALATKAESPGQQDDLDFRVLLSQLREIYATIQEELKR